jgi:3-deoxy-D-manno-octulosonic acid kinase
MKTDEKDIWTALTNPLKTPPPGFVIRVEGDTTCILRQEWEEELLTSGILTGEPGSTTMGQTALPGGRGSASIITLPKIGAVVLRRYRRGGLIGKVLVDRYLFSSRPFRELSVLAFARTRNVPVPEVLGASSTRIGLVWHRGHIVTRLIPDSRTLPVFIKEKRKDARRVSEVLKKAGAAIKKMHEAGIDHADLNMNNILVDAKDNVFIIDFDKATAHRELGARRRIRNLRRLLRSLRKLKGVGYSLDDDDFFMIIRGYAHDDPALLGTLERATLRSRLLLFRSVLHRIIP